MTEEKPPEAVEAVEAVEAEEKMTPMKEWLVNYVGAVVQPSDGRVTVMMLIEQMAKEFPEFLLVMAEENFIRGYQQAMVDIKESPVLTPVEEKKE